jgi:hypothetical protein
VTEPDLNFIAERLLAIQTEITAMRIDITTIIDSQPLLFQAVMRLERDMVRVKDLLGKMDDRIAHLEKATP